MELTSEIIEANPKNLVTKANMLIEANYKLGVVEQKIILCLASNINPSDSDFKTYSLAIKDFNKMLGLKGTPKYTELRQITKDLMQKVFELRLNNKVIQVAWLSYVAYNETEGTIDIRFDPFLRPYLLQLKKEFTSYKLENVVKLKSSYAIRIYELLKQYEKIQERTFQLEKLRKLLGAEDVYPAYGNFKQRVLVPAQQELQKKTDISFSIEEFKIGRRVDKVKFVINTKKKALQQEQLELFEGNDELLSKFKQVKSIGLSLGIVIKDDLIKSWESKFGLENVLGVMDKMQNRTDIDNPIGYITTVLTTTGAAKEVSTTLQDDQSFLAHLASFFKASKDKIPYWFVEEEGVKELKNKFNLSDDTANQTFLSVQKELFEILKIKNPDTKNGNNGNRSDEEKIKAMEERLKKYKKR
jgi:hypothetical protein